jgi:molecular chaperone GrpE (heat shock protein)
MQASFQRGLNVINQNFEGECLALLKKVLQGQAKLSQQFSNIEGQNAFVRHQIAQSAEITARQCSLLQESQAALQRELKHYQTGGLQRAMASIFYRLFRDLLKHMNQLDELAALGKDDEYGGNELIWITSIKALQAQFESILVDWDCNPVIVEALLDSFDPELHEAVVAEEEEVPPFVPENTIVKVRQRGWQLHDIMLQYPQVVVS